MPAKKRKKYFTNLIILILAILFVARFAGPSILRQYVTYGIGTCEDIPILCMYPEEKDFTPVIDIEYHATLTPHKFSKVSIDAPKGFGIIQELVKRPYYKKRNFNRKATIYLLPQDPGAFIKLYPDVRKQGIQDNHEFIRRLMFADLSKISNITDAFFIIMKSIFTPDIGNQNIAKMIKFKLGTKTGYINYTMAKPNNYFDCNVLDENDTFFKLYIKDIGSNLDLNQVFTVISTLRSN